MPSSSEFYCATLNLRRIFIEGFEKTGGTGVSPGV
jgi:hypothetical protein